VELVAGADILPEKRDAFREKWGVTALYADYLEMIERERPDLVAVCTRGDLHGEMGVRVAEAGVPMLYLEKAMACSMQEADAVLEACRRHGTKFNTGVLRRFNPSYQAVRESIAAGEIGEPKVAVHFAASNLLHGHSHSIDTASYLLGDPKIQAVRGELVPRDTRIEGNRLDFDPDCTYQLVFADGAEAWSVPASPWEFEVIGTEGTIRSLNNGVGTTLRKSLRPGDRRASWEEVPVPPVERKSAVVGLLEDLVEAHEIGRPPLANAEVTHHVTEACMAVAESHRQGGGWVELPIENRELYVFHR
jgi:predicted dehydrogenase